MTKIGLGYLPAHHQEILHNKDWISFLEIHPEGWVDQPTHRPLIENICKEFPVSLHGTHLNLTANRRIQEPAQQWVEIINRIPSLLFVSDHFSYFKTEASTCDLYLTPHLTEAQLQDVIASAKHFVRVTGRSLFVENIPNLLATHVTYLYQFNQLCTFIREAKSKLILNLDSILIEAISRDLNPLNLIDQYANQIPVAALTYVPPESMNPSLLKTFGGDLIKWIEPMARHAIKSTQCEYLLIQTRYGNEDFGRLKQWAEVLAG